MAAYTKITVCMHTTDSRKPTHSFHDTKWNSTTIDCTYRTMISICCSKNQNNEALQRPTLQKKKWWVHGRHPRPFTNHREAPEPVTPAPPYAYIWPSSLNFVSALNKSNLMRLIHQSYAPHLRIHDKFSTRCPRATTNKNLMHLWSKGVRMAAHCMVAFVQNQHLLASDWETHHTSLWRQLHWTACTITAEFQRRSQHKLAMLPQSKCPLTLLRQRCLKIPAMPQS